MRTNALRQISTAVQTEICASAERLSDEFRLPEAPGTRSALGDVVVPAIDVKKNTLFGAQTARSAAVDMRKTIAVRLDGIVR